MVKELRDKTAAGMMDCKKALTECDGDMAKAVDWLRQKGLSKAAKKAGRATSEGLIGCAAAADGRSAVMIEVKCETDFVARGDMFKDFVKHMTDQIASSCPDSLETLLSAPSVADPSRTVQDSLNDAIATIGENIVLGRFCKKALPEGANGLIGTYLHFNGKIAVLLELEAETAEAASSEAFRELAANLSMQVAASSPLAVTSETLDPALIEREREVYRQKARAEGKPDAIIDRIADGAVKKYFKEVCLADQAYFRDDKMTVADLVKSVSKTLGAKIAIKSMTRLQLGAE